MAIEHAPYSASRPRAFVIRVLNDGQGQLRGQIGEPGSADEWRATFAGADELWSILMLRLRAPGSLSDEGTAGPGPPTL